MRSPVVSTGLAFHPAAADAPAVDRQTQVALERDIKRNGLHQPIVMLDGQVLEGRVRHEACLAAGVLPEFRQYGDAADDRLDDPAGWAREHCERVLSAEETALLQEAEATIDQGLSVFVAVGRALMVIRDRRLYRERFESFQAFCEDRFEITRRHADRTIQAAGVVAELGPTGLVEPRSEAVARELAALRENPDAMRQAWAATVDHHGDRPTAAQTRNHVTALLPDPPAPAAPRPARESAAVQPAPDTGTVEQVSPSAHDPVDAVDESAGEEHPDPWGRDRAEPPTPVDAATTRARALASIVRDSSAADPRQVAAKLLAAGDAAAIAYLTELADALAHPTP
ncbi:unannotated protein [freshwater metagenome]|uniref:Unannotated protein n=1 Tax=freshwater metagenome TaxID=449393 RepID=A0A6J7G6A8_9ZZZZ|nr:hypothetical protein [Actinomycetota bacterium]